VHLVLRVQTEDALRIHTTTTSEQLREALKTAGIAATSIRVTAPESFRVEGIPGDRDAEFRRLADDQVLRHVRDRDGRPPTGIRRHGNHRR
jgi:hypothetical protein